MGSTITAETVIDGTNTTYIEYFYDNYGPYGFSIDGTFYYYVKNLQGDVTQIRDTSNNLKASYIYDAWGKVLSVTENTTNNIGAKNAIRYRGYYYDTESNLYYLNARYYDPQIKRFISADGTLGANSDIFGYNLYAYCGNNPVNRIDPSGEAWWHWAIGAAIVVACAAATVVTCGGFAAAAGAVAAVASGCAAATAASTIAASALIGSATVYGTAVYAAALSSGSVEEFCDHGDWVVVGETLVGAGLGAIDAYNATKSMRADEKLEKIVNNPNEISKYSTEKFEKVANQSSWSSGMAANGKGYRAYKYDMSIRYNTNGTRFDEEHFYGDPYWKISNGKGTRRIRMNDR